MSKVVKTQNFADVDGKSKHLRRVNGKEVHTGNANYILTNDGVVFHPVNKIFKQVTHKSR